MPTGLTHAGGFGTLHSVSVCDPDLSWHVDTGLMPAVKPALQAAVQAAPTAAPVQLLGNVPFPT
jgi:hypothetical protein